MKFAVGYRPFQGRSFVEHLGPALEHVAELYFAWPGMASGRSPVGVMRGYRDHDAQAILETDLRCCHAAGISLDLLLNSNCYGEYAISEHLQNQVRGVIEHLQARVAPIAVVTTASPAIAFVVKRDYPALRTRASVNLRIGSVKGMEYLARLFDEFVIQRDYNRDLERVETLWTWASQHGKRLHLLANSGCMRFCSAQAFHDNLVAHGEGIDEVRNLPDFPVHACWHYLRDRRNWVSVLQNTWVRPEDLHHYRHWFPVVKLATRMHPAPWMVVDAYGRGQWRHNLLDLMEPGFTAAFAPYIIDNTRFPGDWFQHVSHCPRNCHACTYCAGVLERVLRESQGP